MNDYVYGDDSLSTRESKDINLVIIKNANEPFNLYEFLNDINEKIFQDSNSNININITLIQNITDADEASPVILPENVPNEKVRSITGDNKNINFAIIKNIIHSK